MAQHDHTFTPDGGVDWWCVPLIDSAPLFGALLDPGEGGRRRPAPAHRRPAPRPCRRDTASGSDWDAADGVHPG